MNKLIDQVLSRSRTTLAVMLFLLMAGVISFSAIPVELEPNIEVPFIVVTVIHEGISPEDSKRLLILPMEEEFRSLEGVEEITTYASEGAATAAIEFEIEIDQDDALVDVREAVNRAKTKMPDTIQEPLVRGTSTVDFPTVVVNFIGEKVSERTLYRLAQALRDEVSAMPEVLEANITGHREELLEIIIDPALLESYSISNEQLISATLTNNRLIAAGALSMARGRFSVKVPGLIETSADLFDIPIKVSDDSVITLGQVATIRRTFKDRETHARVNGQSAISVEVIKRINANIIETSNRVKALVEASKPGYPKGVNVFYTTDTAPEAERQVRELMGNVFTAMMLVVIVVIAALGLRSGLLVGFGIPVSFLFSAILLNWVGYTFNFMVMFGLLLALGMLIDGAIVVTEYADRKMLEGHHRKDAYSMAAKRMFWPVAASTATTLAAFLPLFLWPGVSGKFMLHLPVTLFTVLVGSLAYALFFGPTLGRLVGKANVGDRKKTERVRLLESGDPTQLSGFTGFYARMLKRMVRWPILVTLSTVGILILSFALYSASGAGVIFFSGQDPTWATVSVHARGNLSADETLALVAEVEHEILQVPGVRSFYTRTKNGAAGGGFRSRGTPEDQIGNMWLELYDPVEREMTGFEVLEEIRRRTASLAGISVFVEDLQQGPPTGKAVQLELTSRNGELLEPAIARIREYMENEVEGLRDMDDTRSLPGIDWKLKVDRARAAQVNANVTTVGYTVQLVTNGIKVGEYHPDDSSEEVDIRARFPESERNLEALDNLWLGTANGPVSMGSFVTLKPEPSVDTIQRVDGLRVEYVRADTESGILADTKVQEIQAWLDKQNFDSRIRFKFRGASEEQENAQQFLSVAFLLALLLMFILLVTQFDSFYQSSLIMFTVVMSTAGVLLGLVITNDPFSVILTGTGIVALAGIVVNNNIILIDTYNHLRREHPALSREDVIIRTGAQRLRPVVLTTVTTVFGLLPIANHLSIDFINRQVTYGSSVTASWVPLAKAIVSGLSFATLLTLIATPALLMLPERLTWLRRWTKKHRRTEPMQVDDGHSALQE